LWERLPASTTGGSSISYTLDETLTWTWSADGVYMWDWFEQVGKAVEFQSHYGEGIDDFAVEHMFVDFDRRPKLDEIVGEATFHLQEGTTYDLAVDDVTVSIDGVDITISAGSFEKKSGERYTYESYGGAEPKITMKLDLDEGEWTLKVHDIDASAINGYNGVDVAFCIGYMAAKETIYMQIGDLSYIAEE
jgi:hypothetical protein